MKQKVIQKTIASMLILQNILLSLPISAAEFGCQSCSELKLDKSTFEKFINKSGKDFTEEEIAIAEDILVNNNFSRFDKIRFNEKDVNPMQRFKEILRPGIERHKSEFIKFYEDNLGKIKDPKSKEEVKKEFVNKYFEGTRDILNMICRLALSDLTKENDECFKEINEFVKERSKFVKEADKFVKEINEFFKEINDTINTRCMENTFYNEDGKKLLFSSSNSDLTSNKNLFLLKIFLFLQLSKCKMFKTGNEGRKEVEYTGNIGSVFSTGGRVRIVLPKDYKIDINKENIGHYERFATHGISNENGSKYGFKEEKLNFLSSALQGSMTYLPYLSYIKTVNYHNYGIDFPIGGLNRELYVVDRAGKPVKISDEGNWGHMLCGVLESDTINNTNLLVGFETCKPMSTSVLGHTHGASAKPESTTCTGGLKIDAEVDKYEGRVFDLTWISKDDLENIWKKTKNYLCNDKVELSDRKKLVSKILGKSSKENIEEILNIIEQPSQEYGQKILKEYSSSEFSLNLNEDTSITEVEKFLRNGNILDPKEVNLDLLKKSISNLSDDKLKELISGYVENSIYGYEVSTGWMGGYPIYKIKYIRGFRNLSSEERSFVNYLGQGKSLYYNRNSYFEGNLVLGMNRDEDSSYYSNYYGWSELSHENYNRIMSTEACLPEEEFNCLLNILENDIKKAKTLRDIFLELKRDGKIFPETEKLIKGKMSSQYDS